MCANNDIPATRHTLLRRITPLVLALLTAGVIAPARADDLPTEAAVRAAVLGQPTVQAARAGLDAAHAERDQQRAGPHEFVWRLNAQQRRADEAGIDGATRPQRYTEAELAVERTLRSPAKARIDADLGDSGVRLADLRRADAIHEASRALLRTWFDWQRERALRALWQTQRDDQAQLLRQLERRVASGDAARTELDWQASQAAQVEARLQTAVAQEAAARATLAVRYPALAADHATEHASDVPAPAPAELPAEDLGALQTRLTERSHEWALARAQADLAQQRARRADEARHADPTLGLYAARERSGAEHVIGVSISLPWSGEARSAGGRAATAWAAEAEAMAEEVHRKVQAESATTCLNLRAAFDSWTALETARQRLEQALHASGRGWQLGELNHADVLQARRQYMEAAQSEVAARVEARHALLRLQLDLHERWELDD
jgi:outer membrane protein TolC